MLLQRGETMVVSGGATLVRGPEGTPGMLYLTTMRVVFEAGAGGPSAFTAYQEGVDGIWNVHAGSESKLLSGTREYLTIEGSRGRFVFRVVSSRGWVDAITNTKAHTAVPPPPPSQHLPPPPPPPPYSSGGGIVLNVQAPAAPTIMMHCRHCGNLYDATKGRCDKCGAPPT